MCKKTILETKKLLQQLLDENPELKKILDTSHIKETHKKLYTWAYEVLQKNKTALRYYYKVEKGTKAFLQLRWQDYGAIRILDYIDNSYKEFEDLNIGGKMVFNRPFYSLWMAVNKDIIHFNADFVEDFIHLMRQFTGKQKYMLPKKENILKWMDQYPSGLDPRMIKIREENKKRILSILIEKIDNQEMKSSRFQFTTERSKEEKMLTALKWWNDKNFHLRFSVRSPKLLNEMLDNSLDQETMKVLYEAEKMGIPFFVNTYYLSLLNVNVPNFAKKADLAIRDYVLYSKELIQEFGNIIAWEKEDIVQPGKPNAAGWILPSDMNIHRRYPEVAILIPNTAGRACGGLCSSCQRMYGFQRGNLNFSFENLSPKKNWLDNLRDLLEYYEYDSQLRDILLTGGDALMSSDATLKIIFNEIYEMALRKKQANTYRKDGEKYAEILRIRLGTRLPVFLPQRITDELITILANFKKRALEIGIRQFIIQTHFESPAEITPEAKQAIAKLISAGWIITNQLVFTTAAARRGHTNQLRKVLNEIGVLPYYTFSVKGYKENSHNFATNARSAQEQIEEKSIGIVDEKFHRDIEKLPENAEQIVAYIEEVKRKNNSLFLSTDRNVINLPGVGKSQTYRVIGITEDGRRILEFAHDTKRKHSPIVKELEKVIIIESKSLRTLIRQWEKMGEDKKEYESLYGYSISETEERISIYEYPKYDYKPTKELTNFQNTEEEWGNTEHEYSSYEYQM